MARGLLGYRRDHPPQYLSSRYSMLFPRCGLVFGLDVFFVECP